MTLQQNRKYFINFQTNTPETRDLDYQGCGIYSGKQIVTEEGETLYWFNNLEHKAGYTNEGWFLLTNIIL